jgi:hypothetical protein
MTGEKADDGMEKFQEGYLLADYPKDQESLAWIIDFIGQDLGTLDPGQTLSMILQMEKYLFKLKFVRENEVSPHIKISLPYGKPEGDEKKIRMNRERRLAGLPPMPITVSDLLDQAKVLHSVQSQLKNFFLDNISPVMKIGKKTVSTFQEKRKNPAKEGLDTEIDKLLTHKNRVVEHKYETTSIIHADVTEGKLRVVDEAPDGKPQEAVQELKRLVNGIDLDAISRCEHCEKLFLNTRKGIKRFCTEKCNWRFNAKKTREKDPAGYRKKQREIMGKKYEKLRKKQFGPNVKIKRRQRKEEEI